MVDVVLAADLYAAVQPLASPLAGASTVSAIRVFTLSHNTPSAFLPLAPRAHPPDDSNLAAIRRAAEYWRQNGDAATVPADYASKLSLMTDYLRDERYSRKYNQVPDREWAAALGVAGMAAVAAVGLTSWCSQYQPEQTAGSRSHPPPTLRNFRSPRPTPSTRPCCSLLRGDQRF